MTRPFQYHPINNFPIPSSVGSAWESIQQLGLTDEGGDDSALSRITCVGISTFNEYIKYHVRHETLKDTWIRVSREDRKKAIFIEEFDLFLPPNKSYVLVQASSKLTRELLKRIKDKNPSFEYKLREIDLVKVKEQLPNHVRGGWFRDLEITDVSSAAIFGANVSESDEWEKYTEAGKLSSLVIEFSHQGAKNSVMLSSTGAITLYSNYDEFYALGLVEKFNDLVMKFQTEMDPKRKKGSAKTK